MLLTRGRTYGFVAVATDNVALANMLKYTVRLSFDGGATFGAETDISPGTFSVSVKEQDQAVAVRLAVTDPDGNRGEKTFQMGVTSAQIDSVELFTSPSDVEELTRSDIYFRITGADVDLITAADISVLSRRFPISAVTTIDATTREARLSNYLNPKLSEVPGGQVPVELTLRYGIDGTQTVQSSYTLKPDRTAPTVKIVSPREGAGVPIGEVANVSIQAFDRLGIESVFASVNGVAQPEPLANPSLFQFTPTSTATVTIDVRAVDPNGNEGSRTRRAPAIRRSRSCHPPTAPRSANASRSWSRLRSTTSPTRSSTSMWEV
jgi:hypothetical protein